MNILIPILAIVWLCVFIARKRLERKFKRDVGKSYKEVLKEREARNKK